MDAFGQRRVGERARRLGFGQLACVGRHTVTGVLCATDRQAFDWSGEYRVFSKDQWEVKDLFAPILGGVLDLLPAGAPVVMPLDDTTVHKTGTKIPGAGYKRDPLSPKFHTNLIWAQRFFQVSVMLPADQVPGPARAIPVRFEHVPALPKPKKSAPPQEWKAYRKQQRVQNLSTHAAGTIQGLRRELNERHNAQHRWLIMVGDGSYTNQTVVKRLPPHTTYIGRIRKDAKLFYPPRPEDQAPVGTIRRYGPPAPTPEELRKDDRVAWEELEVFGAGKMHAFRVKTIGPVLWRKAGPGCPLRLLVVAPVGYRLRKGSKLLYRQPAYLICTDPNLPLDRFLQAALWRWDIEVNHRDEKQIIGVGEAQVWSPQSVTRQPALAVASYAILLLAGERTFQGQQTRGAVPLPKWQHKDSQQRMSTQELLRQLRSELWRYAMDHAAVDSDHFVTASQDGTKPSESQGSPVPAWLYAATG
jgi:hypothetical protein